jgi:hypothetical protein
MFVAMKFKSKILGLLMIATLTMATLTTGAWTEADHVSASSSQLHERPAGCHEHGDRTIPRSPLSPSPLPYSPPAPVSYQCCLTGHVAAVVQASDSLQLSVQYTRVDLQIEPARTVSTLSQLEISAVLFADPPGTTSLRI